MKKRTAKAGIPPAKGLFQDFFQLFSVLCILFHLLKRLLEAFDFCQRLSNSSQNNRQLSASNTMEKPQLVRIAPDSSLSST